MVEVEQLYTEVVDVAVLRQQWLHDALAVYRMFSEVNACELWIDEKEQWLDKMEIPEKLDDVEVVAHRWAKTEGTGGLLPILQAAEFFNITNFAVVGLKAWTRR